jgi:ribosomal protein S18 acetylase RimI-like enzyme
MSMIAPLEAGMLRTAPGLRRLQPSDRGALVRHLQGLSGWDRVARWQAPRSDRAIEQEVAALDLGSTSTAALAVGAIGPGGIVGAAIAVRTGPAQSEIAVSVSAAWRRRGLGTALVWEAWEEAKRSLRCRQAVLFADSENVPMLRLLRRVSAVPVELGAWELRMSA